MKSKGKDERQDREQATRIDCGHRDLHNAVERRIEEPVRDGRSSGAIRKGREQRPGGTPAIEITLKAKNQTHGLGDGALSTASQNSTTAIPVTFSAYSLKATRTTIANEMGPRSRRRRIRAVGCGGSLQDP